MFFFCPEAEQRLQNFGLVLPMLNTGAESGPDTTSLGQSASVSV